MDTTTIVIKKVINGFIVESTSGKAATDSFVFKNPVDVVKCIEELLLPTSKTAKESGS